MRPGGSEEGLGGRGAPVHQQRRTSAVDQSDAADVDRLGAVGRDHPPQADVSAETLQQAQLLAGGMDLQVTVEGTGALAGRLSTQVGQPVGQGDDLLLQAVGDREQVTIVVADQGRIGLGGAAAGEVEERTGGTGDMGHGGELPVVVSRRGLSQGPSDCAAHPGP